MRVGKKLLLLAALAAMATIVFAGAPSVASGEILHPCWDISKTASVHGAPVTSLTLALDETITVDYEVVVTERECTEHEIAHESVDIKDSQAGVLAVHLDHSAVFHYSRDVTAYHCGSFDVTNTAEVWNSVLLNSATTTIHVTVDCDHGCTLTQGYWKTHSSLGPAPYDDTWAALPGGAGANTAFFLSGQTWYQVFWTAPAGNVYYQLAHQYMAAVLNKLNGASSTSAVDAAITSAAGFFNTYTPAQAATLGKQSTARANALAWAGTLGSYNEGAIGPGHCDA
jgi:hypothetical protein